MHVVLYAENGTGLRAILEAGWLSLIRTGAASGLAARHLAGEVDHVAIIGTGNQAVWQAEGVIAATNASTASVFSRDPERRSAFSRKLESFGVDARPASSAAHAAADAQVIVTMTSAAEPVLYSGDIPDTALLIAAGNNNPARTEIDPRLLGEARLVVVDDPIQAVVESGEIIAALEAGYLESAALVPLGAVVAGDVGRPDAGITIFESQGVGLEDVAVASRLLRIAQERGLGRQI